MCVIVLLYVEGHFKPSEVKFPNRRQQCEWYLVAE